DTISFVPRHATDHVEAFLKPPATQEATDPRPNRITGGTRIAPTFRALVSQNSVTACACIFLQFSIAAAPCPASNSGQSSGAAGLLADQLMATGTAEAAIQTRLTTIQSRKNPRFKFMTLSFSLALALARPSISERFQREDAEIFMQAVRPSINVG